MHSIKTKLIDVFNTTLNKEFGEEDVLGINKDSVQEWDSVQNIILYQRINSELGVSIQTDEFIMCESFQDIFNLIINAG